PTGATRKKSTPTPPEAGKCERCDIRNPTSSLRTSATMSLTFCVQTRTTAEHHEAEERDGGQRRTHKKGAVKPGCIIAVNQTRQESTDADTELHQNIKRSDTPALALGWTEVSGPGQQGGRCNTVGNTVDGNPE